MSGSLAEAGKAPQWGLETHRGFTNSWECDENAHLNVQFYYRRFEEASRYLLVLCGSTMSDGSAIARRHVRYHRELHEGDGTVVHSALLAGRDGIQILHRMSNTRTGALAATAIDTLSEPASGLSPPAQMAVAGRDEEAVQPGLPRGLDDRLIEAIDTAALLKGGVALVSNRSILRAGDLDHDGSLHSSAIISRFTDGAKHIWDHAGVTANWLAENGFGRVAVEMNLSRHARPERSDMLELISWVPQVEGKTFMIRHQLQSVGSGKAIACAAVRCLVMDLSSRRSVALPGSIETGGPA